MTLLFVHRFGDIRTVEKVTELYNVLRPYGSPVVPSFSKAHTLFTVPCRRKTDVEKSLPLKQEVIVEVFLSVADD